MKAYRNYLIERPWLACGVAAIGMVLFHFVSAKLAVLFGLGGVHLWTADFSWIGAEDAASKNQDNVRRTNKLNKQMFEEARGQGGSAVLPLYLRSQDGGLFEKQLGADLVSDYDKTRSTMPDFQAVSDNYQPLVDASRTAAGDIFNGGVERQLKDNAAPVQSARVKFSRQSAVDALNKTLGEINAARAGKGYSGDSFGDALLKFQANKGANDAVSAANLQNLAENQAIGDTALNLKMQSLNLPYQLANENLGYASGPENSYIDAVMKGLTPLSFLRIGGAQPFQYQTGPMIGANASPWTGAANSGAAAAGSALNMWLQNKLANRYAAQPTAPTSPGGQYDYSGVGGESYANDWGGGAGATDADVGFGGGGWGGGETVDWGGEM